VSGLYGKKKNNRIFKNVASDPGTLSDKVKLNSFVVESKTTVCCVLLSRLVSAPASLYGCFFVIFNSSLFDPFF